MEIVSALRRLVRSGELGEGESNRAESLLVKFTKRCQLIIDVDLVKAIACSVLRVHSLRAADALQLRAALAWRDSKTQGAILHTFYRQLGCSSGAGGLRVRSSDEPVLGLAQLGAPIQGGAKEANRALEFLMFWLHRMVSHSSTESRVIAEPVQVRARVTASRLVGGRRLPVVALRSVRCSINR